MVANSISNKAYDIFLSYAAADAEIAAKVELELVRAGFSVFNPLTAISPGENFYERVREELGASEVVVAIFSSPSTAQGVELGGAWAWKKPVYVISDGAVTRLISGKFETFSLGQMEELITKIRTTLQPMTEDQRQILMDVYQGVGIPLDTLTTDLRALGTLGLRFQRKTRVSFSPERLLRELLVMRKSGRLHRTPKGRAGLGRAAV